MARRHGRRLGVDEPRLDDHARAVFASYGRYWAELLWASPGHRAKLRRGIEVVGIEHVRAARAAGKGAIYVLPHIGNWEIAGLVAVDEGIELVAVAEDLADRRLRDWFVEARRRLGIEIVFSTTSVATFRLLESALARNAAVALVADRDLSGRGVRVTFLGEETTLPSGPMALALHSGAPVLPVSCLFAGSGHRLVVEPPLVVDAGATRRQVLSVGTQQIADAFERILHSAPTQWHLLQPNWPSDGAAAS